MRTLPVVRVKICGITREADAVEAARCGASAIGFVFWPDSPRFVTPRRAAEIAGAVESRVARVGVFVEPAAGELLDTCRWVALDAIQVYGSCAGSAAVDLPLIRAVAVPRSATDDGEAVEPASALVLLDAADPERHGGTGRVVDWEVAGRLARRRPTVLAGGLTPENVGRAIRIVRPYGLDVSSGLEAAPGLKDRMRMRAFFDAVRSAAALAPTFLPGS